MAIQNTPRTSQLRQRTNLQNLGQAANGFVSTVIDSIDTEVNSPLKLSATFPTPNARLNFQSSEISTADGAKKAVSPVKKQIFNSLSSPWINFQDQSVSNAADFDIAFPASTVGFFRHVGFTLIGSGKIKALFSAEAATEGALSNPGALFVSGGLPLGYVTLECTNVAGYFKTAGSASNIIENAKIFRFGAGGGGGSSTSASGSGGGELTDLLFQAAIRDSFADIPDGNTTVDIAAGRTDASLHDVANELFRLSYDASKTVSATGTAATISSAPSFTIKAGDMIVITSTGEARRIASISSQTSVTLESAFSTNPVSAAACISQAVHTVDLNSFTAGGTGLSAASQFSGNIDEILVGYEDSDTLGDIIPDFGTAADVAFSASADNSSWSTIRTRTSSLSDESLAVSTPTSSTQLRLRFFANKTSGSGAVNLLAYKVFFHKQTGETVGSELLSAFARPTSAIYQNCSHSVASGKSRFSLSWAFPRGVNDGEPSGSALVVYANGQRVPRYQLGVTDDTQAYFKELSDTLIEMDADYSSAGIDFQFRVERTIIDSNTLNTTRISEIEDVLSQAVDAQVVPTFLTAVNGAPSAGQFRSDITGRKPIIDLSSNLVASFGVNRIMTQSIVELQDEFGSSGQRVFGVVGDEFDQIRFVGRWSSGAFTSGMMVNCQDTNDYVEVVFFGTGLNILTYVGPNRDLRVSVDGGAEGANILGATASASAVLVARNYSINNVVNVVSGLSLGIHTAKIRNNNGSFQAIIYGFEVLNTNSTTNLAIQSGIAVKGKNELILPASTTSSYNSGFESGTLGTRGGNVVVYLKEDGTIGKAVTPTNSSAAFLTSADHSNEEIIRRYNFREFGANRADDFSTLSTSSSRAFTLDDNTTTLICSSVDASGNFMNLSTNGAFITITFVGTGIDIMQVDSANGGADNYTYSIDGGTPAAMASAGSTILRTVKIASGLTYGTHTLKITRVSAATWGMSISDFIIYSPKKPSIPSTAKELAQYYVVANFSANTTTSLDHISQGVIRKSGTREARYIGTFTAPAVNTTNYLNGFGMFSTTIGNTITWNFYGTGFDARGFGGTANTVTISVYGSTNLSGFTTSSHGGAFTAATGTMVISAATVSPGVAVSGLTLGWHTVVFTKTAGASGMYIDAFDVITPIHSPSLNVPIWFQSTLNKGNNSLADLRQFNEKDLNFVELPKVVRSQYVTTGITTTSTSDVLMPEMAVAYYSEGEMVEINFATCVRNDTAGQWTGVRSYLNGVQLSLDLRNHSSSTANMQGVISEHQIVYLPKGFHMIEIRWRVSGGTGAELGSRILTVKKLIGE